MTLKPKPQLPVEILRVQPEETDAFLARADREALKTLYGFSVIWHEQQHGFAAMDGREMIGAARIRIAASLAHVESIVTLPGRRREGTGSALLAAASDAANYYNCHKMSALVPHRSAAQAFFESCGYREEAVLAQHTFKLDIAVLRKFLL